MEKLLPLINAPDSIGYKKTLVRDMRSAQPPFNITTFGFTIAFAALFNTYPLFARSPLWPSVITLVPAALEIALYAVLGVRRSRYRLAVSLHLLPAAVFNFAAYHFFVWLPMAPGSMALLCGLYLAGSLLFVAIGYAYYWRKFSTLPQQASRKKAKAARKKERQAAAKKPRSKLRSLFLLIAYLLLIGGMLFALVYAPQLIGINPIFTVSAAALGLLNISAGGELLRARNKPIFDKLNGEVAAYNKATAKKSGGSKSKPRAKK